MGDLAVVLCEDGHEVLEFHYPRLRLEEEGYKVQVLGPKEEKQKFTSKEGYWAFTDGAFDSVDPKQVKCLIVPGGLLCPDRLRRYEKCLKLISDVHENGGVVGMICHGPWVGISAKIFKGVNVTCYPAMKDDIINAGGKYDAESKVVSDKEHRIVTAQSPRDCAMFMKAVLEMLKE